MAKILKTGVFLATMPFVVQAFSIPVMDIEKDLKYVKKLKDTAESYQHLVNEYINKAMSQVHGSGLFAESTNNNFANLIVRKNQARINNANQALAMSNKPVDVCGAYSLSQALNDLACDSLNALSTNTQTYLDTSKNPYKVALNANTHKITDIDTIAVSTLPSVNTKDNVLENVDVLQEQAYKTSVSVLTNSIKTDKANLYNPLSNQAIDDFSDKAVKEIQESDNTSQLYRKMAVMKAENLTASMLSYKHELQKEFALSLQLLQAVKASTQSVK